MGLHIWKSYLKKFVRFTYEQSEWKPYNFDEMQKISSSINCSNLLNLCWAVLETTEYAACPINVSPTPLVGSGVSNFKQCVSIANRSNFETKLKAGIFLYWSLSWFCTLNFILTQIFIIEIYRRVFSTGFYYAVVDVQCIWLNQ